MWVDAERLSFNEAVSLGGVAPELVRISSCSQFYLPAARTHFP
jgi:hypothetical protein